ncbi:hypothetical protein ACIBVL_25780 [Streptomyces sp. NPDC049687]|uniref:hypothetical protein n=1 Tax=Streptomyces sp. NPDC049687 TaxID=3365596 RepID=UPI0037BA5A33
MYDLTAADVGLLTVLTDLVSASTWDEARDVVDQNPVLLTDRALVLLDLVGSRIATPDNGDDIVRPLRRFLTRSREIGTVAAWEEHSGRRLPSWLTPYADRIESTEDVTAEVQAYEEILAHAEFVGLTPQLRAQILGRAASALLRRSEAGPQHDDIDRALQLLDEAGPLVPDDSEVGGEVLSHLLFGHVRRYERDGAERDLAMAMDVLRQEDRRDGHEVSDHIHYMATMGFALLDRYERHGLPASLNSAVRILQQAVDASTGDDPELPGRLDQLGGARLRLYELEGSADQLRRSVACLARAVEMTATSAPERPGRLSNLGNALLTRYERDGTPADLDAAIASGCDQETAPHRHLGSTAV